MGLLQPQTVQPRRSTFRRGRSTHRPSLCRTQLLCQCAKRHQAPCHWSASPRRRAKPSMTTRGTAAWRSPIRPRAVSSLPAGCDCLLSGHPRYMPGPRTPVAGRAARNTAAAAVRHHETFIWVLQRQFQTRSADAFLTRHCSGGRHLLVGACLLTTLLS